jgi:hypothetical protein
VDKRQQFIAAGVIAVLVAIVLCAGILGPPREAAITTDHLGPEHGETVANYLDRARNSLSGAEEPRFALVSLTSEITPAAAVTLAGDTRVAQVIFHVPIPRVQTSIVTVNTPAGSEAMLRSPGNAATQLSLVRGANERQQRINAVSAARLFEGCACIVGLTVRATPTALTEISHRDDVRAVEALPPDAVAGRFAVVPLLPEHTDFVVPGPDDGDVPVS